MHSIATASELCRLCAEQGHSCCVISPTEAHLSVPLSQAEWLRLTPYASFANAEPLFPAHIPAKKDGLLRISELNTEEYIDLLKNIFPPSDTSDLLRLFPVGGTHYRLRTTATGDCIFLGKNGCVLPREVRPWYCLLYPAWVINNTVTLFLGETCFISQKSKNPMHGCRALGMTQQEIRHLYSQLRHDWGLSKW